MISITIEPNVKDLLVGIVSARTLVIGQSNSELRQACAEIVERTRRDGIRGGEPRRESVRKLLRAGGFKPAGRNKPAQEYLLRTVTDSGELPAILNAVDWLNAVSLDSGLPISLLSSQALGERVIVRYGLSGERFMFNRAGQELDLEGLLSVCAVREGESVPLGTPIKDSMAGKVGEGDADVTVVIYAPQSAVQKDEIEGWCKMLGEGFERYCSATGFESVALCS